MATSGYATDAFSLRPRFQLRIDVTRDGVSGNSSRYAWTLRVYNLDRVSYTYDLGSYGWSANVEGSSYSGNWTPDFRGGQHYIQLGSGTTGYKAHNSNGELTVNYSSSTSAGGVLGSASASGSFAANKLGTVPGSPPAVTIASATPTSLNYTGKSPSSDGSSPLERSQHQITLQGTGWDSPLQSKYYPYPSGVPQFTFTGLSAVKTYAIRMRYENATGWGGWSPTVYGTTLPNSAPGVVVSPSASGTSASVALSPPGGVTGVDFYTLERRVKTPVGAVVTTKVTSSPVLVSGLTPGETYEWRATATFGSYTSPVSDWTTKKQPNPNTNAGDYFDGNSTSPDNPNLDFSWVGTVNLSQSIATMPAPAGWLTFAAGAGASGGTGVVAQIEDAAELPGTGTGAEKNKRAGVHAARIQFNSDATAAGFIAGLSSAAVGRATIAAQVTYIGSIYVYIPGRQQRLQVEIGWYNNAGTSLSTSAAPAQLVPGGQWVRLSVTADSPENAVYAAVRVRDVTGDGWATWKGGDTFILDAAMLAVGSATPYFDGSFVDDGMYAYNWGTTANASESVRTMFAVVPPDPLADPLCPPIPAPPRPPVILDDCIADPPSWRRYFYKIPAAEVSDWLTELPTLIINSGNGGNALDPQGAKQIRIRIYPNPFNYPTDQLDLENFCSEQIISYMPPFTTLTLDGPLRRVFAEVQGSASRPADHLLYGTGGTPPTWPELTCGIQYMISIDEPLPTPPGNVSMRVLLTRRT